MVALAGGVPIAVRDPLGEFGARVQILDDQLEEEHAVGWAADQR